MKIFDFRDELNNGQRKLSALVRYDANPERDIRVFICRPQEAGILDATGDPFLVAFLLPCMALHEDLFIDAAVSRQVYDRMQDYLQPLMLDWHPSFQPVKLQPAGIVEEEFQPATNNTGSLFSAGLDSWYSLAKHERRISHVVHIHGFEIRSYNNRLWETAHAHVRTIAAQLGKTTIPVRTNLREVASQTTCELLSRVGRPFPDFETKAHFGTVLVAIGLVLRGQISQLIIPSSWSSATPPPLPSHALLEPKLSVDTCGFELDGGETNRLGKMGYLLMVKPEALKKIRVCFTNLAENAHMLNCGTCFKCIRMTIELRLCAASEMSETFSRQMSLRSMRLWGRADGTGLIWDEIVERARDQGDYELADTVEIMRGKKPFLPRKLLYYPFRAWLKGSPLPRRAWLSLRNVFHSSRG